MKIAIHTVCKDEKKNIDAWLQNAWEADVVMPVDTGSTDGTWETIRMVAGPKVLARQIAVRPWRFDVARNCAMALLPADVDVAITMDLDERLSPGWRDEVEKYWIPGVTQQAFYRYVFAKNPDGSPSLAFDQHRMCERHGFLWKYPAHEALYRADGIPAVHAYIHGMEMTQEQDFSVNRSDRDLELLEMGFRENPNDQRMTFYYGRQLYYCGRYDEAIDLITRYFAMGKTFAWESAAAADVLAHCWRLRK